MAQQYIHVHIGTFDGVFPVIKHCTSGAMHNCYQIRESPTTTGWVHERWCTPVCDQQTGKAQKDCAQRTDHIDRSTFLKQHWDLERNCLQTDFLDDYMALFIRDARAYANKVAAHAPTSPSMQSPSQSVSQPSLQSTDQCTSAVPLPSPSKNKKPQYVQLSLFD